MRLLALLIFCALAAGGQTRPDASAGESTFTEGMMRFVLEDYAGSLKYFETFVKQNDKAAAGFYMKSRAELALDQLDRAELSAATAVQLDGKTVYYLQHYAGVLQKNHKSKAAQNAWRDVIRLLPDNVQAYYNLLELQADAGEGKEALKTLELAEKQFGASEKITRARQAILLKDNKVEDALKEGKKLAAENPEFVLNQAAILVGNQQKKEAVKLLEKAVEDHPDLTDAYGLLSELYAGEKDRDASSRLLNTVMTNPAFPYSLKANVLGNHLASFGDHAEELGLLLRQAESLVAAYPDQARAYLYAGDISFRLGKPLQARDHYAKAVNLDKNQFEVWLALLQIHFRLGDVKRLEKDADQAGIYFPNQPAVWFYLGWAQLENQRPEDAEIAFEEVSRLGGDPTLSVAAQAGLAVIKENAAGLEALAAAHSGNPYLQYLRAGKMLATQPEEALKLAGALSAAHPADNPYKLLLAQALVAVKKPVEALKVLEFIPGEEAGLNAGYFHIKGDALALLGKSPEAREEWEKALKQDKNNAIIQKKLKEI